MNMLKRDIKYPILFCILFATPSFAAPSVTDRLTWTLPTYYTDGTYMPLSDIKNVNIYSGTSNSGALLKVQTISGVVSKTTIQRAKTIKTACYAVTVIDKNDIESVFSNKVCKTI